MFTAFWSICALYLSGAYALKILVKNVHDLAYSLSESGLTATLLSIDFGRQDTQQLTSLLVNPYFSSWPALGKGIFEIKLHDLKNWLDLALEWKNLGLLLPPIIKMMVEQFHKVGFEEASQRHLYDALNLRTHTNTWKAEEWKIFLNNIGFGEAESWCQVIPPELLTQDNFLRSINLLRVITPSCFMDNPNREALALAASRAIKWSSIDSIFRYMMTVTRVPGFKYDSIFYDLSYYICSNNCSSLLNAIMAQVWRCPSILVHEHHITTYVAELGKGNISLPFPHALLIARASLKIFPSLYQVREWVQNNNYFSMIRKNGDFYSREIAELASDLFEFSISPKISQEIFSMVTGCDFDTLLMAFQVTLSNKYYYQYLPLAWRMSLYRPKTMRLPVEIPEIPNNQSRFFYFSRYRPDLSISVDDFFLELLDYVDDSTSYAHRYIKIQGKRVLLIRPRAWLPFGQLVHLLNFLIYGLIRYGQSPAILNRNYCKVIRPKSFGRTDNFQIQDRLENHDLKEARLYHQTDNSKEFPLPGVSPRTDFESIRSIEDDQWRRLVKFKTHNRAFTNAYRQWSLSNMFLDQHLCNFLTDYHSNL